MSRRIRTLVKNTMEPAMDDEPIKATNDDASECKRCAVQLGYWEDNYISHFIRPFERRTPEINRGYYARVKGIENLIIQFLNKSSNNSQIVNLGCGFDTLYWRLKDAGAKILNFVELDFPSVTAKKSHMIKRSKALLERIHEQDGEIRFSSTDLHAGNYHLMGTDLRNISDVENKLRQADVDMQKPTLFISECVLVYIEVDAVQRLLSWLTTKFPSSLFINYEMVNMNDTFGNIMFGNLRARGCNLAGVEACQNLDNQKERFLNSGWDGSKAWDMVAVYNAISNAERHRIENIEFLDEHELLTQLFQHYCICIAWRGMQFSDVDIAL